MCNKVKFDISPIRAPLAGVLFIRPRTDIGVGVRIKLHFITSKLSSVPRKDKFSGAWENVYGARIRCFRIAEERAGAVR